MGVVQLGVVQMGVDHFRGVPVRMFDVFYLPKKLVIFRGVPVKKNTLYNLYNLYGFKNIRLFVSFRHSGPIDRTPDITGSDKKYSSKIYTLEKIHFEKIHVWKHTRFEKYTLDKHTLEKHTGNLKVHGQDQPARLSCGAARLGYPNRTWVDSTQRILRI